MVPAQSGNMDQARIAVNLFFLLLGQRWNLILNIVVCFLTEILFSGLLNDLNAQH